MIPLLPEYDPGALVVIVGPRNKIGRHVVTVRCCGVTHTDTIDADNSRERQRLRDKVVSQFDLPDESHEWLEQEIQAKAKAVDSQSTIELVKANVMSLASMRPKSTRWFWDRYMPAGAITVLDGDPNEGKSTITCDIMARGSRGDAPPPFSAPDGTFDVINSLLIQGEDDIERTTIPRLIAAGANLERISLLRTVSVDGSDDRIIQLPLDLCIIEQIVIEREIGLVVVDVLSAFVQDGFNMNSDADMRKCLTPAAISAERTGAAWLFLRHMNKKEGTRSMYRGGGSISITGAARAAFAVGAHPDDPTKKVFVPIKHNLGPRPESLVYRIEAAGDSSRIVWEGATTLTAGEVLGASNSRSGGSKVETAKGIIAGVLDAGPRGENEVRGACEQAGVSRASYWRARKDMGVLSEKSAAFQGEWILTMPSLNGSSHEEF